MLTEFGKFVRKLRIDRGLVLYEMVQMLEVSSATLSGAECGRRHVPKGWVHKIATAYGLSTEQAAELEKAAKAQMEVQDD